MDQLRNISHQLRLFGIHASVERRIAEAENGELSHGDFLKLLLEDEKMERKQKVALKLQTKAKFRRHADITQWDDSFDRGVTKSQHKMLATLSFLHNKTNLLLLGSTGAGKTHLAIGVGRLACEEGFTTGFYPSNFFFEEAVNEKMKGRYLNFMKSLQKLSVLILDDFGIRNYKHEEASILLDALEDRAGKGSVIITSQVDPKGWKRLFEDPVVADAVTSRLEFPSTKFLLKGGDYREKMEEKMKT